MTFFDLVVSALDNARDTIEALKDDELNYIEYQEGDAENIRKQLKTIIFDLESDVVQVFALQARYNINVFGDDDDDDTED